MVLVETVVPFAALVVAVEAVVVFNPEPALAVDVDCIVNVVVGAAEGVVAALVVAAAVAVVAVALDFFYKVSKLFERFKSISWLTSLLWLPAW